MLAAIVVVTEGCSVQIIIRDCVHSGRLHKLFFLYARIIDIILGNGVEGGKSWEDSSTTVINSVQKFLLRL